MLKADPLAVQLAQARIYAAEHAEEEEGKKIEKLAKEGRAEWLGISLCF